RQAVERRKNDVRALRGLRDLTVEMETWLEALGVEERLIGIVAGAERSAETTWLATIHYELGRADTRGGRPASAIGHFKNALKAEPGFVPAALALGDALEAGGHAQEAIETREAFAEYRRALRLGDAFDWPHACTACGAPSPAWQDRCPRCRRWNTVRPAPPRR